MTAPAVSTRRAARRRRRERLGFYLAAGTLILVSLAPIVWVLKMSLVPRAELFASPPPIIPESITLTSFETALTDPDFQRGFLNSAIIAGLTTVAVLVLGAPAAYAFARLRFRARTAIMTAILALAFFPAVAVIAPLFVEFSKVGLINTYWAVVIVDTVFALPLAIWILTAFFRQLPKELEEAAKVDGATTLKAFRYVIVPLAAPGVATAAIITFVVAWNEFLFANTFLFDANTWPTTVVIPYFASTHQVDYGAQAAAALLVTVPLAIFALGFQRRIVEGLTSGAVKG